MPPRIMFRRKDRPSGLEFPACFSCNHRTRVADAAAAFFSRMDKYGDVAGWKYKEAQKPLSTLCTLAPDFIAELFDNDAKRDGLLMTDGGVLLRTQEIIVGPIGQAIVTVFAAKLGMALFYEHVGAPLPSLGGVFTMSFLNVGPEQEQSDALFKILPAHSTLVQGQGKSATGQFDYRYNTDGKSLVAALSHFHGNIHFFTVATSAPENLQMPPGGKFTGFIRPGELLQHMPKPRPAILSPGADWSPTGHGLVLPRKRPLA